MINRLIGLFLGQHQLVTPWHWSLAGLLLTVGLTANASTGETVAAQAQNQAPNSTPIEISHKPIPAASLPDGTYLYGQSSEPEQIGKEYIVFEARQGKLIGALYLPSSEFSCFHGTLDSNQMSLTVFSPYDQTALAHSIAESQPQEIAVAGGEINLENASESLSSSYTVGLEGYQQISKISDNDQRILRMCRDNYQQSVRN